MKKIFDRVFKFIAALLPAIALVSNLAIFSTAQAVTQFPPAALLQPGDITTSHVRNGTILPEDLSQTANRYWDMKGDWHVSGNASTTGNVAIDGTLTLNGSCVGCATSYLSSSLTPAVDITKGTPVMAVGTGTALVLYDRNLGAFTDYPCGKQNVEQKCDWTFTPTENIWVNTISGIISKAGTPSDNVKITVRQTNQTGTVLASTTILNANVPGTACDQANFSTTTLDANFQLVAGTDYHIMIERTGSLNDTNYFILCSTGTPNTEMGNLYWNGSSWVGGQGDLYFKLGLIATGTRQIYPATARVVAGRSPFLGFAGAALTAGTAGSVITNGLVSVMSGLEGGWTYFLGTAPGTISTTSPANSIKVGESLSSWQLIISR